MALSKLQLRELYRARAAHYDLSANLYYLLGFREASYRKRMVASLRLKPGDTVVEIGCGTGLNFRYVRQRIGDTGQLIGVDMSDAMLQQAETRIRENGWGNVRLVHGDAASYAFPAPVHGVYSSFALTLIPEYGQVIERAAAALIDGGCFAVLDLKRPDGWPLWLTKLGVAVTRPFGVTLDLTERKPWKEMEAHFRHVTIMNLYGGFAYLAVGKN